MSFMHFTVSDRAQELLENLRQRYGALVLHQSPIYCDGFSPVCLAAGDFAPCEAEVLLGQIGEVPYYGSYALAQYWRGMSVELDANPGTPSPVSLERETGLRLVLKTHRRARHIRTARHKPIASTARLAA